MLGDETVFVMQGPRSPLPKAVSRRDGGRLESLEGEIDAEKQLPHERWPGRMLQNPSLYKTRGGSLPRTIDPCQTLRRSERSLEPWTRDLLRSGRWVLIEYAQILMC
jgi:hypothetical protein